MRTWRSVLADTIDSAGAGVAAARLAPGLAAGLAAGLEAWPAAVGAPPTADGDDPVPAGVVAGDVAEAIGAVTLPDAAPLPEAATLPGADGVVDGS